MWVPAVGLFLSAVVLQSVSAGGRYCAKTAQARAAALGLPYPGVNGAPDLLGPPHHKTHPPHTGLFWPQQNNYQNTPASANVNYDMIYNRDGYLRSPDYLTQAFPRTFPLNHGPYSPLITEYTSNKLPGHVKGRSVSNRQSNFEQVKHVGLPTRTNAPGRSDLVQWASEGRSEPRSFVYNEHNLAADGSVPNRHGMFLSRLSLPQSGGHGVYHRGSGLDELGRGREIPVLGSFHFHNNNNKGHVSDMMSRGRTVGRTNTGRFPGHPRQALHKSHGVGGFVHGNPFY